MTSTEPTILITGGRGQVGDKLLALAPQGYKLVATSRSLDSTVPGLVSLDLEDLAALRKFVRELKPQLIINPAAYTAVDKAESEPELAARINTEAPGVLAEEAASLGIPLIHFSTDYVFDGSGTHFRDESAPTGPLSIYGKSKLEGEQKILATGANAVVLRTSWVFSDHGHNFVKTMLRFGKERPQMRVVDDQVGAPTSAAFLARASWQIAESLLNDKANHAGIYHLVCKGETSWHGFAAAIFAKARVLGQKLAVEQLDAIKTSEYPTPAQRPLNSRLDCRKIEQSFGIERPHWHEALDEVLATLLAR